MGSDSPARRVNPLKNASPFSSLWGMDKLRFSMASLMGLVFFLAVGLAALKSANAAWADLISMVVTGVLLFAILGLIYCRGNARRFWTGFAIFGWAFLLVNNPRLEGYVGNYFPTDGLLRSLHEKIARIDQPPGDSQTIAVSIRTGNRFSVDGEPANDEKGLNEIMAKALSKKPGSTVTYFTYPGTPDSSDRQDWEFVGKILVANRISISGVQTLRTIPDWDDFQRVGSSILALFTACAGGALALFSFRRKEEIPPAGIPPRGLESDKSGPLT